jgi:ATP-dependent DNA helicase RecQ
MCRLLPETEDDFLRVSGVGKRKAEQYGETFTAAIRAYLTETRGEADTK